MILPSISYSPKWIMPTDGKAVPWISGHVNPISEFKFPIRGIATPSVVSFAINLQHGVQAVFQECERGLQAGEGAQQFAERLVLYRSSHLLW